MTINLYTLIFGVDILGYFRGAFWEAVLQCLSEFYGVTGIGLWLSKIGNYKSHEIPYLHKAQSSGYIVNLSSIAGELFRIRKRNMSCFCIFYLYVCMYVCMIE